MFRYDIRKIQLAEFNCENVICAQLECNLAPCALVVSSQLHRLHVQQIVTPSTVRHYDWPEYWQAWEHKDMSFNLVLQIRSQG